jgi:hypothetical protein
LTGFLFQKREAFIRAFSQRHQLATMVLLLLIFIGVAVFARFGIETTINLSRYYHHNWAFILWTLGVNVLWISGIRLVVLRFNDFPLIVFLRWLGENITVFYIIQWIIIGNIATAIYQTQELSRFGFWFGSIFLATIGITLLYERVKILNK